MRGSFIDIITSSPQKGKENSSDQCCCLDLLKVLKIGQGELYMPYVEMTVKAGKTLEVQRYYCRRYHPKGCKREKRKKKTKESQKRINVRKATDKLRWTLNENFRGGDMHIRLSYEGSRREFDQMKDDKAKFLRKLRTEYRKQGKELKFVHIFEIGKRGARHHHLVINSIDTKILRDCWPHGSVYVSLLDNTGQYGKLASYLIKEITEKGEKLPRRYSPSKNLVIPEPKKRIILERKFFRREPKPQKGYYIDKQSVYSGFTDDGYQFLRYIQVENQIWRE